MMIIGTIYQITPHRLGTVRSDRGIFSFYSDGVADGVQIEDFKVGDTVAFEMIPGKYTKFEAGNVRHFSEERMKYSPNTSADGADVRTAKMLSASAERVAEEPTFPASVEIAPLPVSSLTESTTETESVQKAKQTSVGQTELGQPISFYRPGFFWKLKDKEKYIRSCLTDGRGRQEIDEEYKALKKLSNVLYIAYVNQHDMGHMDITAHITLSASLEQRRP